MIIDGYELVPGEKRAWDMAVAESALRVVAVPCTAMRGRQDGPTLVVTAGCHPMELNGIYASVCLAGRVEPDELAGTLIIVHVQNVFGFELKRGHISPLDSVNMARAFPVAGRMVEDTGGVSHQSKSLTYMAADTIFDKVVRKADLLVDLHGGELQEWLAANIEILPLGEPEIDDKTRALARAFGFDMIWEVPYGTIPQMPTYPGRGSAVGEAMRLGIPGVFCEVGSEGRLEEPLVELTVEGLLNVMRTYGMLPGEARQVEAQVLSGGNVLFATRGGLFLNYTRPAQQLASGESLGRIVSLSGETLEEFFAPCASVVTNTITLGVANPGDMLYVLGNIVED